MHSDSSESILRLRKIYNRAREIPPGLKREVCLSEACGANAALRKQVEEYLSARPVGELFFELDVLDDAMTGYKDLTGTSIGRYRILEKLGEGGFGEVFRVEQREPIRRELALKLIKPGMDSREVIARFESERQALALLDHPNIAKIVDAGSTEDGHPYFAMELAVGEPITRYCDVHQLTIDDRLRLFKQVCAAVQHAHQKAIIHRDLKPSNIVVVEQDGVPTPKIIDFGIAKSLQGHLTGQTMLTQQQQFIGTPAYMSPEQLRIRSSELDTHADIYSLGAVLYELITGVTPLDGETLSKSPLPEVHRLLCDVVAPKPSTRVHTLAGDRVRVANYRSTEPSTLERKLRGDLDWIVMKCLEKEPYRRYDTAKALARDLEDYLEQRPVSAAAPSVVYCARKYIQRKQLSKVLWAASPGLLFGILALLFFFEATNKEPSSPGLNSSGGFAPGSVSRELSVSEKSVAVLPFVHLSENEKEQCYTDGIHDGLLTEIAGIRKISTVSRTSVMRYRNADKTLQQIGSELGVRYLVEGSVQLVGNQIRVQASLLNALNGALVSTQTYLRELTAKNYFEIQSDICRSIAHALEAELSPEEERWIQRIPTQDMDALEAYVLGKAKRVEGDVAGLQEAIEYFYRAVEQDPDFAEAHALLGRTLLEVTWPASLSREEQIAKAQPHIYRALELNDRLSEAHLSLGLLKAWQGDLAGEEEAYRQALALNPHQTDALVMIAGVVGDPDERVRLLQKAYELDPEHPSAPFRLAWALRTSGKLEACRQHLEDYAARNPDNPRVYMELADLYMRHLGRYDEAIIAVRKNQVLDPGAIGNRAYISSCYVELGDLATANRMFENRRKYFKEGQQKRRGILAYLFRIGDPVAREQTALEFLQIDPRQAILYAHLAEIYLPAGRAAEALPYFKAGYPELFEPTFELRGRQFCVDGQVVSSDHAGHPDVKPTGCGHVFDLQLLLKSFAALFLETGYEEQARHLIQVALKSIKSPKSLHMRAVEIDLVALSGDEAKAIELLKDHFGRGFSPYPIVYHSLAREFLEKPECQRMIAEAKASMAKQLQRIRYMEARGELPPIPPLPELKEG